MRTKTTSGGNARCARKFIFVSRHAVCEEAKRDVIVRIANSLNNNRYFDKYALQVTELMSLIRSSSSSNPQIVCGDFNAKPDSEHYSMLKGALSEVGLASCCRNFEKPDADPTANPPGERLLTRGKRIAKVLDFVFATEEMVEGAECVVGNMEVVTEEGFEMISDHAPVEATFRG